MAALTAQKVVDSGVKPTFAAPTLSDTAPVGNGYNSFLVYKNTDTNIKTLTITPIQTTDSGDLFPAHVVTVAASTGEVWLPLRKSYDNGTGSATVVLSGTGGVTGVTVALVVVG